MSSVVTPDLIKRLEVAAETALGSQLHVTVQKRQEAEDVLLSFRHSSPSYQDCRVLLENTAIDTVQYQACVALKEAVLRQWKQTQDTDKNALQEFIIAFVMGRQDISSFVREMLTQVLAAMVKLSSVNSKDPKLRESLHQFLTNLISQGNPKQQLIACSVTSSLMTEFSINTKSSDMGITMEQHWQCKKVFEKYDLKFIVDLTFQVLKHLCTSSDPLSSEMLNLLEKFLRISEQLFTWTFTSSLPYNRRSIFVNSDRDKVIFEPPMDWQSVILNPENIHLFFALNNKCRRNEDLSKLCLSCISQLASMQGKVVGNDEKKCFFLSHFVKEFLRSYGAGKFEEYEALGVSNICGNLFESFKVDVWVKTPETQQLFQQFVNCLTNLTCTTMAGAAKEELLDEDDHMYMEAFEIFLNAWTTIISAIPGREEFLVPSARLIFEHYVKHHIMPPDGWRQITSDENDIDEIEEDDRDRFSAQLISVAALARLSLNTSLTVVISLLQTRISLLHENLRSLQSSAAINEQFLDNLYEDLHWLILIAGHILSDGIEGHTCLIPTEIIKFSISQKPTIDTNLTLQLLGSPEKYQDIVASVSSNTLDLTVRLVALMFSFCHMVQEASRANMTEHLSPEVLSDLVCFLKEWINSYLFFKEDYYDEISPAFSAAFGPDSEGAKWCIDYITKFSCSVIYSWSAEPGLLNITTDLLGVMVSGERRCSCVALCEEFWKLGNSICSGDKALNNHPPNIKQQVMTSVVIVGTSNMNMYKEKYWEQTMNLIENRYRMISIEILEKKSKNPHVINEFLLILDLLCGIAEGGKPQNTLLVFNFLSTFLSDGGKIVQVCHGNQSIIISVLELFALVAHGQICFLKEEKCRLLYDWTLSLLKSFSIITKSFQSRDSKEESFQDLSIVIEILTHLMDRDFIDFSDPDLESKTGLTVTDNDNKVEVATVVLYGLSIILPHLNTELLSYPTLCCQYYKLVTFLCEIYPEKVEKLPQDVFGAFIYSLQLGLTSYGNDNCKLCLEAILGLFEQARDHPNPGGLLHSALFPFIKMVFDVILVHANDMELLRTAGETFYAIFCFDSHSVLQLFSSVVENQTDPNNKQRLISEFNKLPVESSSSGQRDRQSKVRFIKAIEDIIFNIRGILCVK